MQEKHFTTKICINAILMMLIAGFGMVFMWTSIPTVTGATPKDIEALWRMFWLFVLCFGVSVLLFFVAYFGSMFEKMKSEVPTSPREVS